MTTLGSGPAPPLKLTHAQLDQASTFPVSPPCGALQYNKSTSGSEPGRHAASNLSALPPATAGQGFKAPDTLPQDPIESTLDFNPSRQPKHSNLAQTPPHREVDTKIAGKNMVPHEISTSSSALRQIRPTFHNQLPSDQGSTLHSQLQPISQLQLAGRIAEYQARRERAEQAYEEALAKYMTGPVVLEIPNLAVGLSVKDLLVQYLLSSNPHFLHPSSLLHHFALKVKFEGFGGIIDCTVVDDVMQGSQPTQRAMVIFGKQSDAELLAKHLK